MNRKSLIYVFILIFLLLVLFYFNEKKTIGNVVYVGDKAYHFADTNKNFRIEQSEIDRVSELSNNGGGYKCLSGTVDGFAKIKYHTADTNKSLKIEQLERDRALELFSNGKGYHCDSSTIDKFAPGYDPILIHSSDTNKNLVIEDTERNRTIELYNSNGYHCSSSSVDGYSPGNDSSKRNCENHDADYNSDWIINSTERLQVTAFYNAGGYIKVNEVNLYPSGFVPLGETGVTPVKTSCTTPHDSDYENFSRGLTSDWRIDADELGRLNNFSAGYYSNDSSFDKYSAGIDNTATNCLVHDSDYSGNLSNDKSDWKISGSELLRLSQFKDGYERNLSSIDGFSSKFIEIPIEKINQTITLTDSQFEDGIQKNLSVGDAIRFYVDGDSHKMTLTNINSTKATFDIRSSQINLTLVKGQSADLDVNDDDEDDIEIKLINMTSNSVNVSIMELDRGGSNVVVRNNVTNNLNNNINPPANPTTTNIEEGEREVVNSDSKKKSGKDIDWKIVLIVVGIAVFVGLLLSIIFIWTKKKEPEKSTFDYRPILIKQNVLPQNKPSVSISPSQVAQSKINAPVKKTLNDFEELYQNAITALKNEDIKSAERYYSELTKIYSDFSLNEKKLVAQKSIGLYKNINEAKKKRGAK